MLQTKTPDARAAILTRGLTKRYGARCAVEDVSLAVPRGSVYGFIGPNGAGKSTTMKLLLGLLRPTQGEVYLLGQKLSGSTRRELLSKMGALIESPSCYAHLTGEENLRIIADLKGAQSGEIERALSIVRLSAERGKRVKAYSLGMRQRLGIAMALLGEPQLLILDEPTNGLDPAGIQEMRELIRALPERTGATVLVSSHLLSELEQVIDHVGVIDKGKLLFQGTLTALRAHSRGEIALRALAPDRAQRLLAEENVRARREGAQLLLPPMEEERLAQVVARLCAGGAGVVGVAERERTLEEIFFSLTGENRGEVG